MDRERRAVDDVVALDHVAVVVDEEKVRDADHAEVTTERVHPEVVEQLGVTSSDVARGTLVVAELGPEPERGGQSLLAVESLLVDRGPSRRLTSVRLLHERGVYGGLLDSSVRAGIARGLDIFDLRSGLVQSSDELAR